MKQSIMHRVASACCALVAAAAAQAGGAMAQALDPSFVTGDTWSGRSQVLGDGSGVHDYPALVGDVNDDGKADVIFVGQGWDGPGLNIRTKLSNGDGTWTSKSQVLGDGNLVHTYPTLTGDVNGDGKTDLVFVGQGWSGAGLNIRTKLSNGDGSWTSLSQVLGDGSGVHDHPALVGDVNGDGKTDIIFVGQNWSGPGLNIRTKLSNGNGTWQSVSQISGDGPDVHTNPAIVGDVNGDGKTDFLFVGQGWSGPGLNIYTKLSNGDGTWTGKHQVLGDGSGVHTYPALSGDVNGDGKADVVFVGQGWDGPGLNIRSKLSNGDGTWTSKSEVVRDGAGVHDHPALIGHVNNDLRADIIFVGQDWSGAGLNIRTRMSGGDGTWANYTFVSSDGPNVHNYPALVGDVNGDGRADIIFVGQDWSGAGLNIRVKLSIRAPRIYIPITGNNFTIIIAPGSTP
jgi:hypothetical protein